MGINKAIYLALGVKMEGTRSCWACGCRRRKGTKFWSNVLTELQNRGVKDTLIVAQQPASMA